MFELNENIKHGTEGAYSKKKCRCDLCKKAVCDYRKNTPIKKHGTKWGYDKGCRCDQCKKAKSQYWHKRNPNTRKHTTSLENNTRICSVCKELKSLNDFPKNKTQSFGRAYRCKTCFLNDRRANYKERFGVYKYSAKSRGIDFSLSFEEFMLFWNKPCYYCLSYVNGIGLDRIDSNTGYHLNNVVSCCSKCNRAKGTLTTDQFIEMCKKISENFKNYIVSQKGNS